MCVCESVSQYVGAGLEEEGEGERETHVQSSTADSQCQSLSLSLSLYTYIHTYIHTYILLSLSFSMYVYQLGSSAATQVLRDKSAPDDCALPRHSRHEGDMCVCVHVLQTYLLDLPTCVPML